MFEKIIIKSKEKVEFEKYLKIKGEFLYKQIYDILLSFDISTVKYSDMKSVIKYDKNLRDILYIYLATFEEGLRAEIFRRYDVKQLNYYREREDVGKLCEDVYIRSDGDSSNLYYSFQFDLGLTIEFIKRVNMYGLERIKQLNTIRQLRNMVMHHNLLTCGKARDVNCCKNHLNTIKKKISVLGENLPYEFKKGYINSINKLLCDRNEFKIVLAEALDGKV